MVERKTVNCVIRLFLLLFVSAPAVMAQAFNGNEDVEILSGMMERSRSQFEQGMSALREGKRGDAKAAFDESLQVFLASSIDTRQVPRLTDCYEALIDTINGLEFPTPGRRAEELRVYRACGWEQIPDGDLADRSETSILQGFASQPFEPSPLDTLSQLKLTQEETDSAYTESARTEYVKLEWAASASSLGFSFQMHPMVQQYLNYYQGRGKATMRTGLYRSGMFMRMARRIFREEGIPENVAWLGQVESMWKPTALSTAAASGLWQFIPSTGERFGLRRTAYVDERNSFEKATRASARYLKFLANRYRGNWELAMAAYNSGEGNVDRAIRRAGVNSFWAAYPYLPQETRNYVPNILATILIANSPNQYGFGGFLPAPQLEWHQVKVKPLTDLAAIARSTGTTVQYLRYLNPELRSNVTPPEVYAIRIPTRPNRSE